MAQDKKSTSKVDNVRPYLEGVAKNLVDRLYGPDGPAWGTTMTELEDVVVAVREALSENMLAQALERQAGTTIEQRPAAYRSCPQCGGPVGKKPKPATGAAPPQPPPRSVQTRGGPAAWIEPEEYCRNCRRSFFPSEQKPGPGSARLQSGHAEQDRACRREQPLV
jgi:hypothetical protein